MANEGVLPANGTSLRINVPPCFGCALAMGHSGGVRVLHSEGGG